MWARTKEERTRLRQMAATRVKVAMGELTIAVRALAEDEPRLALLVQKSIAVLNHLVEQLADIERAEQLRLRKSKQQLRKPRRFV
jgi:hypothetical protein